jgi:hypothetical protein
MVNYKIQWKGKYILRHNLACRVKVNISNALAINDLFENAQSS